MDPLLLLSLIGISLYGFSDVIRKDLRNKGVDTLSILSIYTFSVPIFIVIGAFLLQSHSFVFTREYLFVVGAWVLTCFLSSFGMLFVFRYQALTEASAYKFAFSALFGLVVDVVFFSSNFEMKTVIGALLLLAGGFIISNEKIRLRNTQYISMSLGVVFFASFFSVIDYSLYKVGLGMQDNILLHMVLTQIILFSTVFAIGFPKMIRHVLRGDITWRHIVSLALIIVVANLGDAYIIHELPLAIALTVTIISFIIYSLYDLLKREIFVSWRIGAAISCVAAGIVILSLWPA